jgi:hypothetical protein
MTAWPSVKQASATFLRLSETAFRRKDHHHPGGRPETLERMYRGAEVAVSREDDRRVETACDAVFDQHEGNADIGLLLS